DLQLRLAFRHRPQGHIQALIHPDLQLRVFTLDGQGYLLERIHTRHPDPQVDGHLKGAYLLLQDRFVGLLVLHRLHLAASGDATRKPRDVPQKRPHLLKPHVQGKRARNRDHRVRPPPSAISEPLRCGRRTSPLQSVRLSATVGESLRGRQVYSRYAKSAASCMASKSPRGATASPMTWISLSGSSRRSRS